MGFPVLKGAPLWCFLEWRLGCLPFLWVVSLLSPHPKPLNPKPSAKRKLVRLKVSSRNPQCTVGRFGTWSNRKYQKLEACVAGSINRSSSY